MAERYKVELDTREAAYNKSRLLNSNNNNSSSNSHSVQYEVQAEGGIGTATPRDFRIHNRSASHNNNDDSGDSQDKKNMMVVDLEIHYKVSIVVTTIWLMTTLLWYFYDVRP